MSNGRRRGWHIGRPSPTSVLLALFTAGALHLPGEVAGQGCTGQKWCFESERFAFRITDNEVTIDMLRRMDENRDATALVQYLLDHESRFYLGWLRPTPEMHGVVCEWNVGLRLRSGEVVWAEKWFVGRRGRAEVAYDSTDVKVFTPGLDEESRNGRSYIVVLAFPNRTKSGRPWKGGQVEGLAVQTRSPAITQK